MEVLLGDEPILLIEGIALVAVGIGLSLASLARSYSRRSGDRIAEIFWRDLSQAGYLWAGATVLLLFGAFGEVEGLRTPVWLVAAVIVGGVCLAVARLRWTRLGLAPARSPAPDASRPDRPRISSTTWEVATLSAGAGVLLVYGLTLSHGWGHPIHWLIALLGGAFGYAAGLALATPRYSVRARSA